MVGMYQPQVKQLPMSLRMELFQLQVKQVVLSWGGIQNLQAEFK